MKRASLPRTRSIESLPENLFREPIDCLYADHFRLRAICDRLDRLATEALEDPAQVAREAIAYLKEDLPLHIADEEDILPLLRTRCDPVDNIDAAVSALHGEHQNEMQLCEALLPHLNRIAAGPSWDQAAIRTELAAIAERVRQHLAREERLILPLARRRLLPADMCAIGRRMAARRGVVYPED